MSITRKQWPEVRRHLLASDALLLEILPESCPFKQRRNVDLYHDLLQSVVSQQLSTKAADTIFARFLQLFDHGYPDPDTLAKMSPEHLRTSGISRQKALYLQSIANMHLREPLTTAMMKKLSDDDVIKHLTAIKGVGEWTAQMILMFSLQRPDVLPVLDLGIQQAMQKLYGFSATGKASYPMMVQRAEAWRPYRSAVCRCLWPWLHRPDNR